MYKAKVLSPHEELSPKPSDFFPLSHARDKTKNIFLSFFTELKTYYLSFLFTNNFLSANSQNIFFQFAL